MSGGHTPGPWFVHPTAALIEAISQDAPIAAMCWPTDERTEDETYANALLASSAPDLLEALETVVSDCSLAYNALGNSPPQFDSVRKAFTIIESRARAAIAKATGQ